MGTRRKGRVLAFQALYSWDTSKQSTEELLSFNWMDEAELQKTSKESLLFSRLLITGTLEKINDVDKTIKKQLEHWDFDRLARVDLAILRLSVYSLMFQDDIPSSVTIDEAIDISKDFGTDESYKFINGVLDGIRKRLV